MIGGAFVSRAMLAVLDLALLLVDCSTAAQFCDRDRASATPLARYVVTAERVFHGGTTQILGIR